jgi:hypothetical protein
MTKEKNSCGIQKTTKNQGTIGIADTGIAISVVPSVRSAAASEAMMAATEDVAMAGAGVCTIQKSFGWSCFR